MIARRFLSATLAAAVLTIPAFVPTAGAATKKQTPAKAGAKKPKDATGQCEDGSYTRAKTQQGACSSHGGVKTWYGEAAAPATTSSKAPAATSKAAPPAGQPAPQTSGETKAPSKAPTGGTPGNATAKCKDGTYSYAKTHSGACSHHGGVAEWYK